MKWIKALLMALVMGNTACAGEELQTMRQLARNMAFLVKSIQLGKEKFGLAKGGRVDSYALR